MLELSYSEAHSFVKKNSYRGYRWDGYDIVRWVKNPNGYSMPNGSFKNDAWGLEFRVPVSDDGKWRLKRV
jgi:hypothetical protein